MKLIPLVPSLLPPKDGRRLRGLAKARISQDKKDERSLSDQESLYRSWLDQRIPGLYDLDVISGVVSGEVLDGAQILETQAALETGKYDFVIFEDLGRLARRMQAFVFCETAEDLGTRVFALNDGVDTGQDNWRTSAFFAAMRHEMYNADTAKKIRRSLRNRFQNGGIVQSVPFSYRKPDGCDHDGQLEKILELEPYVLGIVERLEQGATYSEVADWLNAENVPMGRWSRSKRWTGVAVRNFVYNPLLKGVRVRNRKMSRRVNKTGRRRSVKAPPEERLERQCPHLAWIEPERYDRLIAQLTQRNAKYTVGRTSGHDPRRNRPKKRTRWPGQHARCGICGRPFVYGGHGRSSYLMCRGAREYRCWNAITFDGPAAARAVLAKLQEVASQMPDYDTAVLEQARAELAAGSDLLQRQRASIERRRDEVERQLVRVTAAIAEGADFASLRDKLAELERDRNAIGQELQAAPPIVALPACLPSLADLRERVRVAFVRLRIDSPEFGRLMHSIIESIELYPYRSIDGGHLALRAHVRANLISFVEELRPIGEHVQVTQVSFVVDLGDPPQRIKFLDEVVAMTAAGKTQRQIAAAIGVHLPAVQRAAHLHRLRQSLGVDDVYQPLTAPPADYGKLRRHNHPRYRFERES